MMDSASSVSEFVDRRRLDVAAQEKPGLLSSMTTSKTDGFASIANKIHTERLSWTKGKGKRRSHTAAAAMKRELSSVYLLEVQRVELLRLQKEYDGYEEAMTELEQELDTLELNIENALNVLTEQVNTVLLGKMNDCATACERIVELYADVASSREETVKNIPNMIKSNIDIVMGRVLKTALAKSGGIHSELDLLFAKTKRSGSLYRTILQMFVNLDKRIAAGNFTLKQVTDRQNVRLTQSGLSMRTILFATAAVLLAILVILIVMPD